MDKEKIEIVLGQGRSYTVRFAPLAEAPALLQAVGLRKGRCLVVTDENVHDLYGASFVEGLALEGWQPHRISVPPGEETKSLAHLARLYDVALSWGVDRQTPVLALGGGVVGDLAGYAAATLLRGLPLVQLPTSLIAQVDSALGGKTGINHTTGKNLIGAFHQPALVLADPATLASLPVREWTSGLAEVVKHALIADAPFFDWLEAHWEAILTRKPGFVRPMVRRAAAIKAAVVSEDERELGRRAILNFGHTFGHAVERVAGYGVFTHGEAVALGMRAALHLSHHLHPTLPFARAEDLLLRLPIPAPIPALATADLYEAMQTDKKKQAGGLRFVLLRTLGEAYVVEGVARGDVEEALQYALASGA